MNWKQLLLAGALAASAVEAFTPSQPASWVRTPRAARQLPVRHLVESKGADAFSTLQEKHAAGKTFSSLPAPVVAGLFKGLVPAAALSAAALLPVPVPLKIIGAYAGALLGTEGRRRLVPKRDEACLFDLATLLDTQDFTTVSPTAVSALQAKHDVPPEAFTDMKVDVFAEYFLALLKSPEFKSAEVKELTALKETLGLSVAEMGDALCAATEQTFIKQVQWTSSKDLEDDESLERMTVDKCCFLVARLCADLDTPEGAAYTTGRCQTALQVDPTQWASRTLALATPLYQKALDTAMTKLDKVTPENVQKAQKALGLALPQVHTMHEELYRGEIVNSLVATDPMVLTADAKARLGKLQVVLGLSEAAAQDLLMTEVMPVYEYDIEDIMAELLEDIENTGTAVGQLAVRMNDLKLEPEQAQTILIKVLQATVAAPFEEAVQYMRTDNTRAALGAMQAVLQANGAAAIVLDAMVDTNLVTDAAMAGFFATCLPPTSAKVGEALYKVLLKDTVAAADESLSEAVAEIEEMMGINEVASVRIFTEVCGPMLKDQLFEAIAAGDYSEAAKDALAAKVAAQRIPASVYAAVADAAYAQELAKGPADKARKLITKEERDTLDDVRSFLGVDDEAAFDMHLKAGAAFYEESVADALGACANGLLSEQFRTELAGIVDRLQLRPADADAVFQKAVLAHLAPMSAKLVKAFEEAYYSKEQLAQLRGKDGGEDLNADGSGGSLGLSSGSDLLTEVNNLVEFFEGNALWSVKEGSDDAKPEYNYLVTLNKMVNNEKVFEELFKKATVMALQQTPADGADAAAKEDAAAGAARKAKVQLHLAGLLGFGDAKKTAMLNEIGGNAYSTFVSDRLRQTGEVSMQDVQQLVSIQEALGLEPETATGMLWSLKKTHAQKAVDTCLRGGMKEIRYADVQTLKAVVDKVGVDLVADLKLDGPTRIRFFLAEVGGCIAEEQGDRDVASAQAQIKELQETWELSEDVAEAQFSALVAKKIAKAGSDATQALAGKRDAQCLAALQELAAFAPFAAEPPKVKVESDRAAQELVTMFKASMQVFGSEELPAGGQAKLDTLAAVFAADE